MADKTIIIDHHTPSPPSSSSSSSLQLTDKESDSITTTSKTIKRNIGKDSARETKKKKKKCPAALDKIHQPSDFSFSFDTNFDVSAPEFTPKFGSFNSELVLKLKVEEEREDGCLRSRKRSNEQGVVEKSKKICEDGID